MLTEEIEYIEAFNEIPEYHLTLPQTDEKPVFHHAEIERLYHTPIWQQPDHLADILSLPRATLIKDLEEVLLDSIRRCKKIMSADTDETSAAFHAIFLLGHLKAKEALPTTLEILRQGHTYIDVFFGDYISEDIWETYFHLFDLDAFVAYLKEPKLCTYSRSAVYRAIEQKWLHGQLSLAEVVSTYTSILQHFIDHSTDSDYIDGDLIGLLICDMMSPDLHELLPIIKQCFDLNIVNEGIGGDYDMIVRDFDKPHTYRKCILKLNDNMEEHYRSMLSIKKRMNAPVPKFRANPSIATNKIGRNDPCPCGSGKKYKKCCIDI